MGRVRSGIVSAGMPVTGEPVVGDEAVHEGREGAEGVAVPRAVGRIAPHVEAVEPQPAGPATGRGHGVEPFGDPQGPGRAQRLAEREERRRHQGRRAGRRGRLRTEGLHRRQRGKNLVVAGFLIVMVVLFFALTIVRMGDKA